jgi:hypothetical protein
MKKGVGSGSINQRYRYRSGDPDPHQMTRIPNTALHQTKTCGAMFLFRCILNQSRQYLVWSLTYFC